MGVHMMMRCFLLRQGRVYERIEVTVFGNIGGDFIKRTDESIILEAYYQYPDLMKYKKPKKMPLKKQITIRKDLQARIDRILFHLKSEKTLLSECEKLIAKGKVVYQQYVEYSRSNPGMFTQAFLDSIDHLLEQMAKTEAKFVFNYRMMQPGGNRIDLEALMKDEMMVKQLLQQRIVVLLEKALSDTDFTMVSQGDQNIYITASGRKYHVEDCVFCKGRKLIPVSIQKIKNLGLKPCKCMENADKVLEKEIAAALEPDTLSVAADQKHPDQMSRYGRILGKNGMHH